jgi:hypothetical protein
MLPWLQDVANTCWALATLCQQQQLQDPTSSSSSSSLSHPPWQLPAAFQAALLQQAAAAAASMTGQGVSNTLWGLGVLRAQTEPRTLLALLQRAVAQGAKLQPQEFANTIWGAARCLQLAEQQLQSADPAAAAAAAAAAGDAAAGCKQLMLQLLQQFGPQLSATLQPRDWSNIIWGAGFAQVRPDKTLLQALWRKTPAGFSTSLNPHYALGGVNRNSRLGSSSSCGVQAALLNPTIWSPQALSNTLWGCARLRVKPPKIWLQGFEAASVAVLAWFSDQQLANTLWAFGELRQVPSDAWLHMFWQQAGGMSGRLLETAAAAAAGDSPQQHLYEQQQQQQWGEEEAGGYVRLQRELLQQGHVVQVLQACSRLGLQPPVPWLQEAVRGLCMAASVLLEHPSMMYNQQQQQQQQQQRSHGEGTTLDRVLLTYAAAVLHLSELAHKAAQQQRRGITSSSSGRTFEVATAAGQQLLQMICTAAGPQQQQQGVQLPAAAALTLLLCLPKLQLPTATANAVGAALLWTVQQQQQQLSGSQMTQLAFAVAELAWTGGDGLWLQLQQQQSQSASQPGAASSSSSRSDLLAAAFTDQLATSLKSHISNMSVVDLRFSIAAVAKLQCCTQRLADNTTAATRSSSGSSSKAHSSMQWLKQQQQAGTPSRPSTAVAGFAGAAGAAAGGRLGSMTPHQRAVVAASLAQLGYSPGVQWVEALLHYSSCDLSGCRNGDLVRLVRGLPLLLGNMQRQQQQQVLQQRRQQLVKQQQQLLKHQQQLLQQQQQMTGEHTAATQLLKAPQLQLHRLALQLQQSHSTNTISSGNSRAVPGLNQQLLREWLADWLSESEGRLAHFIGTELVAVAQGLARLGPWLRSDPAAGGSGSVWHSSRQQQQQLPASWQESFLAAAAARVLELSTPELLMLLAAVRRLGLAAGQEWCSTVASTIAARAAAAASGDGDGVAQMQGVTEDNVASVCAVDSFALRVHHIGWLALHMKGFGYQPTEQQQEQLLRYVATACDITPAAAAAAGGLDSSRGMRVAPARPVPAKQLWQVLVLLAQAGWVVDEAWVQRVQGSAAGVRLRAWLGQRRHLGTWRGLWAMYDR